MKKELKTDLEKIAYNCRKATFLIEKKQEEELTAQEKMELKLHLAGCYICRIYEQQSLLINDLVKNLFNGSKAIGIRLDDDYKAQLQKRINEKIKKN